MAKKNITVTGEQMKRFVRGEILLMDVAGVHSDIEEVFFTGGDGYQITLEDLTAGLLNYRAQLEEGTIVPFDFFDNWVLALFYDFGDLINMPEFLGMPGKPTEDLDVGGSMFMDPFFENETELSCYVYARLFDLDDNRWVFDENPENLLIELQDLLDVIRNYPKNKGKKKSKWKLTDSQILNFVYHNGGDNDLKDADEETISLWKKYLEKLAAEDDANAVKILGYACYGDDHFVYDCDWERSRDCMLKLMEIAGDEWKAMAANTLGYIYYYGRTNGGVPEYEAAYKYFSLAAFFGYYEAIYKVGDMLMAGKGTPKNETAAFHMYRFVYDDCFPKFLEDGIGSQFADAGLRMGGAYHKGKGVYPDLMRAYGFYLQARVAIDNRMKKTNFFGNTTVSAGIRNSISDIRKELGDSCRQKLHEIDLGELTKGTVFEGVREVRIKVERRKTETHITFRRRKGYSWGPDPNMLFTFPDISLCRLSPEVKVSAPDWTSVEVVDDLKSFKADKVKLKKQSVHFYYKKKLVMSVERDGWYIKAEREKGSGKMHQFVGICIEGSERVYDYLCDGVDIKPGDYVVVPSYNGPVKVKAVRVYEQSEADAPLEITQYKKAEKAE